MLFTMLLYTSETLRHTTELNLEDEQTNLTNLTNQIIVSCRTYRFLQTFNAFRQQHPQGEVSYKFFFNN